MAVAVLMQQSMTGSMSYVKRIMGHYTRDRALVPERAVTEAEAKPSALVASGQPGVPNDPPLGDGITPGKRVVIQELAYAAQRDASATFSANLKAFAEVIALSRDPAAGIIEITAADMRSADKVIRNATELTRPDDRLGRFKWDGFQSILGAVAGAMIQPILDRNCAYLWPPAAFVIFVGCIIALFVLPGLRERARRQKVYPDIRS
jgi:hypothetical protein